MDMILGEKTIVNVDEASYCLLVRQNYSWLPRGLDGAIINSKWVAARWSYLHFEVTENGFE